MFGHDSQVEVLSVADLCAASHMVTGRSRCFRNQFLTATELEHVFVQSWATGLVVDILSIQTHHEDSYYLNSLLVKVCLYSGFATNMAIS